MPELRAFQTQGTSSLHTFSKQLVQKQNNCQTFVLLRLCLFLGLPRFLRLRAWQAFLWISLYFLDILRTRKEERSFLKKLPSLFTPLFSMSHLTVFLRPWKN